MTFIPEEKMIRFLHGWDYDVNVTEAKILESHEYMTEHNYYEISDDRV